MSLVSCVLDTPWFITGKALPPGLAHPEWAPFPTTASFLHLVFTKPDLVQEGSTANEASMLPALKWVMLEPGTRILPLPSALTPQQFLFTCWFVFSYLFDSTQLSL